MKRLRPDTARPQSPEVITITSSPQRPHKKDQKPPWRLRLSRGRAAIAAAALFSTLITLLLLLLRGTNRCYNPQPSQRLILTASHLRPSDGDLRLQIITHNLKLLFDEPSNEGLLPPLKSIVIFSHDGDESTLSTIKQWKLNNQSIVHQVKLVPNDAINVDVSKWMAILENTQNAQVMLLNDSFLLLRPIPELWDCTGVCGLGWTAPKGDASRHFQSYLRVLSPCDVNNYMYFYKRHSHSKNVQELIQSLEVNLSWTSDTKALYECDGGHPDEDEVQRRLLTKGYPAMKLKKFFETSDPWLQLRLNNETASGISPSLDLDVYRSKNHDLNHLSDRELEDHFAELGWKENRVYSTLPLVMKRWLREELESMVAGGDVVKILEEYLVALNGGNRK